MKTKLLPAAALAAACLALSPGLARAAEPNVPYTAGDLILGFQQSGANDLEVDIGPYTKYLNATSPFNVTFGVIPANQAGAGVTVSNLTADLSATYGSGWASNSGASLLQWGIIGDVATGASFTTYLTIDSNNSTIPVRPGNSGGSLYDAKIGSLSGALVASPSTANSTEAASVLTTAANSWDSFNPGNSFGSVGLPPIEQAFGADGPTNSTLNLWQDAPNGKNGGGNAVDIGSFTLDGSGDLTYTPVSVPEPSTWASIIGGAIFLGLFRFRRSLHAS